MIFDHPQYTGGLRENDVMISANPDEILSRASLARLRQCELAADVVSNAANPFSWHQSTD